MTVPSLDVTLDSEDDTAVYSAMYRICGRLQSATLVSHDYPSLLLEHLRTIEVMAREHGKNPLGYKLTISSVGQRSFRHWPSNAVYTTSISRYPVGATRYGDQRRTRLSYQSSIELRDPDFKIDTWLPNPTTGDWEYTRDDTRYTVSDNTLTFTGYVPEDDRQAMLIDYVPVSDNDAEDILYQYSITYMGNGVARIQSP